MPLADATGPQSPKGAGTPPPAPSPRKPIDKVVFGVAAVLSVAFVVAAAIWPDDVAQRADVALGWVTANFDWLFVLTSAGFVAFSAYLAFGQYGGVRLGPDDSEPEFSTFSWVSMMFATGMGIGLIFWGVAEPLTYLNEPPMGRAEPDSAEAAGLAIQYSFFHWSLHPWAMYAVIGLAIAYFAYRKNYGNAISATFRPLLGRYLARGPGKTIDVIAIIATLFGTATSLGLGALQITGGLANVFGTGTDDKGVATAVVAVLTACFVVSAVSGIHRGIKYLSNSNAVAAVLLVLFLFVAGPTVFILGVLTEGLGSYLSQLPRMSFTTGVYDPEARAWLSEWTIFYWAWWISWTPFVGMFIARISKGRTIREFVIYVLLVPSAVSFVWFAILGGSAIDLQLNQGWRPPLTETGEVALEPSLFDTLRAYPLSTITVALTLFLIAIFFITGADSASIVMAMLSRGGAEETRRPLIVFWGVTTGAVAAVLLWAGGLRGLQTLVIMVAGPFMLVLVGVCVSLLKELRREPFESTLPSRIRRAVQHNRRHRDDRT